MASGEAGKGIKEEIKRGFEFAGPRILQARLFAPKS
jgi:hypothetical protein